MVNVLIMTHGGLAKGLSDAAQMILGPKKKFDYLSFMPDWSLDRLVTELVAKLKAMDEATQTLVMVDLFGGTPSNAIATLLGEGYEIGAVAGINLPMLIEALMSRDEMGSAMDLAEQVCQVGRDGVVNVAERLLK